MGWGPMVYHRYGHGALCVVYDSNPARTRCYNYGTTDFSVPVHELSWSFLRGSAKFWVSPQSYSKVMRMYQRFDRSIWVQRLPFTQAQVDQMAARLEHDLLPENRYYTYHHFDNNCTTRLRDHLDIVAAGALRADSDQRVGQTFRQAGRLGVGDKIPLVIAGQLLLGRRLDDDMTRWEAMFHPDYLREMVRVRLGAEPVQVYQRRGPPMNDKHSWGRGWMFLFGLLLAAPVVAARLVRRFERAALGFSSGMLTLCGLLVWSIAIITTVPEFRYNEVLLLFWPTDLLLVVFGERKRMQYARIRVVWLALMSVLMAAGVLVQELHVPALIPAMTCLPWIIQRRPNATSVGRPGSGAAP